MEKFLEKISNYHFLNTLIPGACIVYFSKRFIGFDFLTNELIYDLLIIFILGLFSGRLGSVIIESILKKIKIIRFEEYEDYLRASKKDIKITELAVDNNLYRAMIAAFIFLLIEKLFVFILQKYVFLQNYGFLIISIFVIIIYVLSYRKQTKHITNRIKFDLSEINQEKS